MPAASPGSYRKAPARFTGFADKILLLQGRGMTTRDIQRHWGRKGMVPEEERARQSRPLAPLHPLVCLDALVVKRRDNGVVQNRAVSVASGVRRAGRQQVPGLWSSADDGAEFRLPVLTEWKNRGRQDIFLACVDGRNGFPPALETVYPQTTVQLCLVHSVRGSWPYVNGKERRPGAQD